MEFPEIFLFSDDDEALAAEELARQLAGLQIENPLVLASVHGAALAARLEGVKPHSQLSARADQHWASELGSHAHREGADAVVAIGGGRCLDLGKLAAARAGVKVVTVPTQLAHDGICSPVAVVPNEQGVTESLGAVAPLAVFISLPTLIDAPVASLRAGLGDLLANPLALRDWALAAERGIEETDERAWDLSVEAFNAIEPLLDEDPAQWPGDFERLKKLADALVLSGMAMICSGTSRPASGGEHEISHAIDEEFGGRRLHGEQVAFGCIISVALYGEDTVSFRSRLKRIGLPQHPGELGLSESDTVHLILRAPETRPGRYTILEATDLDEAGARKLVKEIWYRMTA